VHRKQQVLGPFAGVDVNPPIERIPPLQFGQFRLKRIVVEPVKISAKRVGFQSAKAGWFDWREPSQEFRGRITTKVVDNALSIPGTMGSEPIHVKSFEDEIDQFRRITRKHNLPGVFPK